MDNLLTRELFKSLRDRQQHITALTTSTCHQKKVPQARTLRALEHITTGWIHACTAKHVCNNPNFSRVTETTVSNFIKAIIAINMQHIRQLVCNIRFWAYSIAFDVATNRGDAYLDVRLRALLGDSKLLRLSHTDERFTYRPTDVRTYSSTS